MFGRQAVRDEAGLTAEALSRTHQHTHDAKHTHVAKHRQQHQKYTTRPQTTSQRARPAAAARHANYLWQCQNSALPLAVAKQRTTKGSRETKGSGETKGSRETKPHERTDCNDCPNPGGQQIVSLQVGLLTRYHPSSKPSHRVCGRGRGRGRVAAQSRT